MKYYQEAMMRSNADKKYLKKKTFLVSCPFLLVYSRDLSIPENSYLYERYQYLRIKRMHNFSILFKTFSFFLIYMMTFRINLPFLYTALCLLALYDANHFVAAKWQKVVCMMFILSYYFF